MRVTALEEFDQAIEASHRALDGIAKGDPSAFFKLYSDRGDATLANPFGPPARGRSEIEDAGRRAGSNYRDGRAVEFENFAKCVTAELAYIVEIERFEAKVGGERGGHSCGSARDDVSFALKTAAGRSCIATRIR